jgi:hypothetical protein
MAVAAERSEVARLVRATIGDREQMIDIGGRVAAHLAAVAVTFKDLAPHLPPCSGAASTGMMGAVGLGCEPPAGQAGLEHSVPPDHFETFGLMFEPVERHRQGHDRVDVLPGVPGWPVEPPAST